ncbi:FMN-dependent NADH-azoreductase [Streptomyces sp. DH37]|uniref:FMN-dependent NADH-azoreductase n=1 Tax=Streptomyces sp. DH37 TaxID=3040122 RepID=UPI0024417494|nr:NAD(P)H-dependent oxidoreductase [Streptomyces sp. DH37]MDG9704718.1 NAD(P)H-dependent oxidoreductase [Streptomyces sp. DH37]
MTHLLHIDCSAVSQGSVSKELAAAFRKTWAEGRPDGAVVHRDLGVEAIPHLDEAGITSQFIPSEVQSPEQKAAGELREKLVEELLGAEAVVVSSPMYNWTIPSTLKAWIDQVLVAGRTLTFGDDPNPLAGRPATLLLSYGGGYTPGAPQEHWNHVDPYLRTVFEDALGMDLTVITAQLTLAGKVPGMEELIEMSQKSREDALRATEERAGKVTAALAAAA